MSRAYFERLAHGEFIEGPRFSEQPRDLTKEPLSEETLKRIAAGVERHLSPVRPDREYQSQAVSRVAEAQGRVDELRERFSSYDGGDRAPSPPARLLTEIAEAEAELNNAKIGAIGNVIEVRR